MDARAYVISASIRGEVPLDVIRVLRGKDATLSADVQGFVRVRAADGRLEHREWPEMRTVLALIDILKTDAVEAESLTGESDIRAAARTLADFGPREIVLTHRDGLLVYAEGEFYEAAFHPENLVGRSGRGDTCLGSYVAKRLTSTAAQATLWAAALTSLKMEAEGPIRRPIGDVEALLSSRYSLSKEKP